MEETLKPNHKKRKIRFKKSVRVTFWVALCFLLIVIVEQVHRHTSLKSVYIDIDNREDNDFLDSLEVARLLRNNNQEELKGKTFNELSIKTLEARVEANLFVQDCEIARNLRGDLFVEVNLSRPIARFIRESKPDFYVDSLGKLMPVLDRYTARTVLITRAKNQKLPDFDKKDKALLKLLNYINQNKFLKAQIAQIDIDERNELTFIVQAGNHIIEFGKCTNIEDKLKRLNVFYQEILPVKGWSAYKRVSLKYKQQIICE